MSNAFQPGCLVSLRGREWVVLPSDNSDILRLRPLSGNERQACAVYLPLALEHPHPARFPPPNPRSAGDYQTAHLLWDAARLSLRSGAGPFRCLGRLSVRPRPYQLVPLLMALRQDVVRLLIADDVGIGKTIEAGLIAREMLDRGIARRLAVLCPPYLCEQWQKQLAEKFHIDAVIVRSGTAAKLERDLPRQDLSIFQYYPHIIVSIDYAKFDRRRDAFLLHCPDLVIVDEAHGAARPAGAARGQQQRHDLVTDLAKKPERCLLLLTATPHSGIEESFRSLLGLISPRFGAWDLNTISERQRSELARHFVQRRRADVLNWMGEETAFPERISSEAPYKLSPPYHKLFEDVFAFTREMVRSGETLTGFRRRVRYWAALALLRCVMSSPAAAEAALEGRVARLEESEGVVEDDAVLAAYVSDNPEQEVTQDVSPAGVVAQGEQTLPTSDQRRLRDFAKCAAALRGAQDTKLDVVEKQVADLLAGGSRPIVYCRYIPTADYVATQLADRLKKRWPDIHVESITGLLPDDERTQRVATLGQSLRRVLVATDCLSEGIDLQDDFDAVVHYDLPWNPNRLEQREGRVDRYGQRTAKVKAVLIYGDDNPIDGAVLDVLIRKAIEIRKRLGISVPVPVDSESVVEAVLRSLFWRGETAPRQLEFSFGESPSLDVDAIHRRWDRDAHEEVQSRSLFAQYAVKPDEVKSELEEADAVLGDPQEVEHFAVEACQRLGAPLQRRGSTWQLDHRLLPDTVRERLGVQAGMTLSFSSPPPDGAVYIGRNHILTSALADYLFDAALDERQSAPPAARCAVVRTRSVTSRTTLLLLRIRHLLQEDSATPALAEECVVAGFRSRPDSIQWLAENEALNLLSNAHPDANVTTAERERLLTETLDWTARLQPDLEHLADEHAQCLHESHRRVRRVTREGKLDVKPQLPVDLLGVYVLMPVPGGVTT